MKQLTLREARKRAGLSQQALADAAGVDQTMISKYETGRYAEPLFSTAIKIAKALNLDPRVLQFGQEHAA